MRLTERLANFAALILISGVLFMPGCGSKFEDPGRLRDLAFDSSAKNIALLFGAPNGLPGIGDDLNQMKKVLEDSSAGNAFEVIVINEATKEKILEATRDAAVRVGQNGTLFWYFSGHGAQDGTLMTIGGMLPFSQVTDAIKASRDTPVKRMFAFFDSCFSGQMVDGGAVVKGETLAGSAMLKEAAESYAQSAADTFHDSGPIAVMAPNAYEQLIVMSASQRSETSLATSAGSMFTNSVANVFRDFKKSKPGATIGDFLTAVSADTRQSSGGHHTPAYRVMPEQAVLGDSLFKTGNSGQTPAPQSNPNVPRIDSGSDSLQPPAQPQAQPQSGPARLIVGLGASNESNGSARLYVLTAAPVTKVGICSGSKNVCVNNPQVFLEFRAATAQSVFARVPSGGFVLESVKPLVLESGKPVTFLGFDAAGKVVVARSVKFRK